MWRREGGGGWRAESNVGRQFDGFFDLIVWKIDGFVYPWNERHHDDNDDDDNDEDA